eukprot:TRINITY_DN7243_c0_g3_i2.p1 TRINITY_DN7243_c0_g3~~TRINITY_DN7243_c0_g3_i2.p1  ORF type:complete len:306 (+),score=83.50 TRINITY_DN7243_c0_g3_i2:61-918(+)
MTAFTPQQLSGQKGYRHRTFVGNWSEDMQCQEDEMQDYMRKRDMGELLSQQISSKKKEHNKGVQLEPEGDGLVRSGQLIVLQNGDTQGYLSMDIDDELTCRPHQKIALSTVKAKGPVVRNTWTITPLPHPDDEFWASKGEGDVIHYGQKVQITLNNAIVAKDSGKPLRLTSELLTPSCHSKTSRQQEVAIADHGTYALSWEFIYANPEYRFEMEGQPVKANSVAVLAHCATGQYLASHKKTVLNDFGAENEVFAAKLYSIQGKNNEVRPEAPFNHWVIVTGVSDT